MIYLNDDNTTKDYVKVVLGGASIMICILLDIIHEAWVGPVELHIATILGPHVSTGQFPHFAIVLSSSIYVGGTNTTCATSLMDTSFSMCNNVKRICEVNGWKKIILLGSMQMP